MTDPAEPVKPNVPAEHWERVKALAVAVGWVPMDVVAVDYDAGGQPYSIHRGTPPPARPN